MLTAHIITLFPDAFTSYFDSSIMRIAREKNLFEPKFYNLSDFSDRPQGRVDDAPYGGGAGQLIQVEPVHRAVEHIESEVSPADRDQKSEIRKFFLGPAGDTLHQSVSEKLAQDIVDQDVIILCGHYEGVDYRVFEMYDWEIYRIGDYVISSGELASMVFLDSIVRLLPGVVGNPESLSEESFGKELEGGIEYPHYTRPADFMGYKVPEVLMSGDHKKIDNWRKEHIKRAN